MKLFRALGWGLMLATVASAAAEASDSGGNSGSTVQVPASQPGAQRQANGSAPQRAAGEAGPGRMSVDERRQLRRDIHDAGKDIYRPARHARGDSRRSKR